jgi:hypothetical protein
MKSIFLCAILLLILMIPSARQPGISIAAPLQGPDVSHLVPKDLGFATAFVQTLSDSGWSVERVAYSKFNGGMLGTKKAAWVKTDKGVLEVLFFERSAEVEQIQIKEEADSTPSYHHYTVTRAKETHPWCCAPVYFTKNRTMLIISYDRELADALNKLLVNQGLHASGRT